MSLVQSSIEAVKKVLKGQEIIRMCIRRGKDHWLWYLGILNRLQGNQLIESAFFVLFNCDDDVAFEAGRMIETTLSELGDKELIELDLRMRNAPVTHNNRSGDYQPEDDLEDLIKLNRFPDPSPFIGLCTFSRSGYMREQALDQLSKFRTGAELKFLLLRLNDWVPQIRKMAKDEVMSRIHPQFISFFFEHLDLIERIHSWHRDNYSDLLKAIEEVMVHPESREEWFKALKHQNVRIRRAAARIVSQAKSLPLLELFHLISCDPDPMVRLFYVLNAKQRLDTDQLLQLIEVLKQDKCVGVRREILLIAVNNKFGHLSNLLSRALTDSQASMRELARWHLKMKGQLQSDFQEHYRSLLIEDPHNIGAILGLGEVGEESDAYHIFPLLNDPRAKVRKAAFCAVSRLKPDLLREIALNKLHNDTTSLAKQASKFMIKHLNDYAIAEIWEIFTMTSRQKIKFMVVSMIDNMSKWARLLYLLKASEDESQEVRANAEKRIENWILTFNRSYTQLRDEEASQIRELISRSPLNAYLIERLKTWCL